MINFFGEKIIFSLRITMPLNLTVNAPGATSVRLTGPFWNWDTNGGPVASDNGDDTWTVTLDPAPTGNMEYLWVVDGVQENLISNAADDECTAEFDGGSLITDYANWANRVWVLDSGDRTETYEACAGTSPGTVSGCTDATADNYNASATVDDGSCLKTYTLNMTGEFDGFDICGNTNTFEFPSDAQSWAGVAHEEDTNAPIYPLSFLNNGLLTINASADASTNVTFTFERMPYPNTTPSFTTQQIEIGPTQQDYTVAITSTGADTYQSVILKIIERDQPVVINSVTVQADASPQVPVTQPGPWDGVEHTRFGTEFTFGTVTDDGVPSDLSWNPVLLFENQSDTWGNGEVQKYKDFNETITISGGTLIIKAETDQVSGEIHSGRVAMKNDIPALSAEQGKEIVISYTAKLNIGDAANTTSLWPALWMMGTDIWKFDNGYIKQPWAGNGEIDVMEWGTIDNRTVHHFSSAIHIADEGADSPSEKVSPSPGYQMYYTGDVSLNNIGYDVRNENTYTLRLKCHTVDYNTPSNTNVTGTIELNGDTDNPVYTFNNMDTRLFSKSNGSGGFQANHFGLIMNLAVGGQFTTTSTLTGPATFEISNVSVTKSDLVTPAPTGVSLTVSVPSGTSSVRLTGPFWGWDPAGGPEASDNSDGTWTVTLDPAPTETMQYLWVVDGMQENLYDNAAAGECTAEIDGDSLITDYSSYGNRVLVIGSGDVTDDVYNACAGTTSSTVPGCTDPNASNYSASANVDDGSCVGNPNAVFSIFDGTTFDSNTNTFEFPSGAQSWAGFSNDNTSLYPFSFPNGGTLTFNASVPSDASANINFKFEKNSWPDVEPTFTTSNVTVSGSADTSYSVYIPPQDALNTYQSFLMYIVERDIPVIVTNVLVTVNDDTAPVDVPGCTDPTANNYNDAATTDDGSCTYPVTLSVGQAIDFNAIDIDLIDFGGAVSQFTDSNTIIQIEKSDGANTWAGTTVTIKDGSQQYGNIVIFPLTNGNSVMTVEMHSTIPVTLLMKLERFPDADLFVEIQNSHSGSGWETLSFDFTGTNAIDNNLDKLSLFPNFDAAGTGNIYKFRNITFAGSNTPADVPGCTHATADNYNADATSDDGSCVFSGCTNDSADNYDSNANNDDGSCVFSGCTNPAADNYDANANNDDGSCVISGCTNPAADNYNDDATSDDGSCVISGCTDSVADNYNAAATSDDGSCLYENIDVTQSLQPTRPQLKIKTLRNRAKHLGAIPADDRSGDQTEELKALVKRRMLAILAGNTNSESVAAATDDNDTRVVEVPDKIALTQSDLDNNVTFTNSNTIYMDPAKITYVAGQVSNDIIIYRVTQDIANSTQLLKARYVDDTVSEYHVINMSGENQTQVVQLLNDEKATFDIGDVSLDIVRGTDLGSETGGGGDGGGASVGDPHIKPIFGNVYELPNKVANYRMAEGSDFVVNAGTRYFTQAEKDAIRSYYIELTGDAAGAERLITNGVVQNRVFVQNGETKFTYNFDTQEMKSNATVDYTINQRSDGAGIVFNFNNATHGKVSVECRHYSNPQVFSGVMVDIEENKQECCGLLIRNYNTKAFELNTVTNTESKEEVAKEAQEYNAPKTTLQKVN